MNHRQSEKRYKRLWRQLFSKMMEEFMGAKVKPSRIKLRVLKIDESLIFSGSARGYTFKIKGIPKEAAE